MKPGERSIEYRAAFAPEDNGQPSSFAQRLHYQQSLNDNWRVRLIGLTTMRPGGELNFRAVQIETLWQFRKSGNDGWASGLLTNLNIPFDGGKPYRLRFGWTNEVDIGEQWQVRGIVYAAREFGENSQKGLIFETRAEATYELSPELRLGGQMFSKFGPTAHFGSFNEQTHQLGFVVKGSIMRGFTYNAGALFGLSRAASDVDLRLFLAHSL